LSWCPMPLGCQQK